VTSGTAYSPPQAFGRFRLLHQIGAGVLGPVFRTHDPDNDRLAAVKAFTLDLTPEQAEVFANDLRGLTTLDMPHTRLAAPLDAGVEASVAYLAMQYVAGESLDAAIRQYGPAPAPDAARLISHVAEALDAGARVGVFHGTLHPRDILVTPGETHLTGLGVATALEHVGVRSPVRRPYAAPEREAGGTWGAAADVFSLAAIAHEVLTGRRALPGSDEPLPGLDEVKAHDAAGLREVLEASLDADPERRPANATDVANAIAAALGLAGGAASAAAGRPASPRRRVRAKLSPKLPGLDEPLATRPEPPRSEPEQLTPVSAQVQDEDRPAPEAVVPVPSPRVPAEDAEVEMVEPEPAAPLVVGDVGAVDMLRDAVESPTSSGPPAALPPLAAADVLAPAPAAELAGSSDLRLSFTPEPSEIDRPSAGSDVQAFSDELAGLDRPIRPAPDSDGGGRFGIDGLRAPGSLASDPPVPRVFDSATPIRATSPTRRVEPYRRLPAPARGVMIPIGLGLVAGLLIGVFVGYWLGSRSVVRPGTVSPSTVTSPVPTAPDANATAGHAGAPSAARSEPTVTPLTSATSAPQGTQTLVPEIVRPPALPPRAAPAAAARPVPVDSGRIRVRSVPASADVFLDGERQGVTPRDLPNLPFGRYTVRVTRPGYAPQERAVTVGENSRDPRIAFTLKRPTPRHPSAPAARAVRPRAQASGSGTGSRAATPAPAPAITTGALSIDTRPPGARVRLDGRDVGVSPISVGQLNPGSHSVRLELPGYTPWTTTVVIKAGDRLRVAASMERVTSR